MKILQRGLLVTLSLLFFVDAHAGIRVTPLQASISAKRSYTDINVQNNGEEVAYVNTAISTLVWDKNSISEQVPVQDPRKSGLMTSPNKLILQPGEMRKVRIQRTQPASDIERLYMVRVSPVVVDKNITDPDHQEELKASGKVEASVKILIAYSARISVLPIKGRADFEIKRDGKKAYIINKGNLSVLFSQGKQCVSKDECVELATKLVYPNTTYTVELPDALPVTYSAKTSEGAYTEVTTN